MSHLRFSILTFPIIFVLLQLACLVTLFDNKIKILKNCLVTLFDRKIQVFKNSSKLNIFGIFYELLSTQNVKLPRLAHNLVWDFFSVFKHRATEFFRFSSVGDKV